jgi:hypothetical protein
MKLRHKIHLKSSVVLTHHSCCVKNKSWSKIKSLVIATKNKKQNNESFQTSLNQTREHDLQIKEIAF